MFLPLNKFLIFLGKPTSFQLHSKGIYLHSNFPGTFNCLSIELSCAAYVICFTPNCIKHSQLRGS